MSSTLDDALALATGRANRMVELFRGDEKAPSSPVLGGTPGFGAPTPNLGIAREQVQHFRGWAFAAVRCIAQRIAGQPIRLARKVVRRAPRAKVIDHAPGWVKEMGENLEPVDRHPILDSLNDPNPVHTPWSLKYLSVCSLELTGRCYWWLATNDQGKTEVWPLATAWVTPLHEPGPFASFEVRLPGMVDPFTVPSEEMVHLSYPDPADPIYGALAPLQAVARAVVADAAIEECQRRSFQSIHPGLMLTIGRHPDVQGTPGQRPILTRTQRQEIIALIKAFYRGVVHYDEPMILDGMIESATPFSRSPQELAFLESGKVTKERTFLGFGVNSIVAGQIEGVNRASAVAADDHFTASCVNPKCALLSECLTGWLCPRFNEPDLVLWIEPARAQDVEQERLDWDQAVKARAVTINEVRARIGLGPIDGGDSLVSPTSQPQASQDNQQDQQRLILPTNGRMSH